MFATSRKVRWVVAAPLFVVANLAAVAVTRTPLPGCAQAKAWVASNSTSLPRTLSGISRYPLTFRKNIVAQLPIATQRNLWREQFAKYLSPTSGLNAIQRAVVADYSARFDSYTDPTMGAVARLRDHIDDRVHTAFSPDLANEIFGVLGPADGGEWKLVTNEAGVFGDLDLLLRKAATSLGLVEEFGDCFCNLGTDMGCPSNQYCALEGVDQCDAGGAPIMCGPNGCDGMCYGG